MTTKIFRDKTRRARLMFSPGGDEQPTETTATLAGVVEPTVGVGRPFWLRPTARDIPFDLDQRAQRAIITTRRIREREERGGRRRSPWLRRARQSPRGAPPRRR